MGTGEDDRPWYRIISEKAHKEKLWEGNDIISESSMAFKFAAKKSMLISVVEGDDSCDGGLRQGNGVTRTSHQDKMTFVPILDSHAFC